MQLIMRTRFGSHLYGTETETSDTDYKSVFIPDARAILLQRVTGVINKATKTDGLAKNSAADIDDEAYSLQKFLALASEGQTVAMDMLFTIDAMMEFSSPLWTTIRANRGRLLSSRCASFVSYCRQQANKYGIKGSRMAAARVVVEFLEPHAGVTGAKLGDMADGLAKLSALNEYIALVEVDQTAGAQAIHLEVCGRKAPLTGSIKNAYLIYKSLFNEYGKRSLAAEQNQGIDWKALSHAVRVGREAIELLQTGAITFPRPERAHLIDIKCGRLPYKPVADEIERLLEDVERVSLMSALPKEADRAWIDDLVAMAYGEEVARFHTALPDRSDRLPQSDA